MKHVNASVNLEKMFVIINNVGIKINVDVNVKNFIFYLFIHFILFNVDFVSYYNEIAVLIN